MIVQLSASQAPFTFFLGKRDIVRPFCFFHIMVLMEGRVVRAPPSPAMSPLYNKADCHHQSRSPGWAPGWHIRPNPTTPQHTSATRGDVEPGFTGMESPGGSHHFFASLPPARSQMSIDTAEIMKSLQGLSLINLFISIFQHVYWHSESLQLPMPQVS